MINNFSSIIKADVNLLSSVLVNGLKHRDYEVANAATRAFATLGMAYSGVKALTVLAVCSGPGVVIGLAGSALMYALFHDLFVISVNRDKGIGATLGALGRGVWADAKYWNAGRKGESSPSPIRHPHAEETFFRPVWDRFLWEQDLSAGRRNS